MGGVRKGPWPISDGCFFNTRCANGLKPALAQSLVDHRERAGRNARRVRSLRFLPALVVLQRIAAHRRPPAALGIDGRLRNEGQHHREVVGVGGRGKLHEQRVGALAGRMGEGQVEDEPVVATPVHIVMVHFAAKRDEGFQRTLGNLGLEAAIVERKRQRLAGIETHAEHDIVEIEAGCAGENCGQRPVGDLLGGRGRQKGALVPFRIGRIDPLGKDRHVVVRPRLVDRLNHGVFAVDVFEVGLLVVELGPADHLLVADHFGEREATRVGRRHRLRSVPAPENPAEVHRPLRGILVPEVLFLHLFLEGRDLFVESLDDLRVGRSGRRGRRGAAGRRRRLEEIGLLLLETLQGLQGSLVQRLLGGVLRRVQPASVPQVFRRRDRRLERRAVGMRLAVHVDVHVAAIGRRLDAAGSAEIDDRQVRVAVTAGVSPVCAPVGNYFNHRAHLQSRRTRHLSFVSRKAAPAAVPNRTEGSGSR